MVSGRRSGSDRREVELHVNGRRADSWWVFDLTLPFRPYQSVIPADLLHPGVNVIELRPLGDLESPADLGLSDDARKLGVGARTVTLRPAEGG